MGGRSGGINSRQVDAITLLNKQHFLKESSISFLYNKSEKVEIINIFEYFIFWNSGSTTELIFVTAQLLINKIMIGTKREYLFIVSPPYAILYLHQINPRVKSPYAFFLSVRERGGIIPQALYIIDII